MAKCNQLTPQEYKMDYSLTAK